MTYIEKNGYSQKPAYRFQTKIFDLHDNIPKNTKTVPDWIIDKIDAKGIAIWFMDDGIVAMEIMRRAPERVTHLALMATNPRAEDPAVSANRERQKAQVRQGHLPAVLRDEMKPNYLADSAQRGDILDLCMTMALQLGPEVFVSQSEALATRPDQQDSLKQVTVPSLILCGKEDRLCPPDRHILLAQLISGARLEIIDGAGHLPTLEQPEATNTALRIWLDGAKSVPPLPPKEIEHV